MRFTPTGKGICRVIGFNVFSKIYRCTSQPVCVSYLKNDNSGEVGETNLAGKSYYPSTRAWDRVEWDTPVDLTGDFWIAITLPNTNSTDSTALVTDGSLNSVNRTRAYQATAHEWQVPPNQPGDFMIRAIVEYVAVEENRTEKPFYVGRNFPNPVISNTTISYTLPSETNVKLEIFDASGRVVNTLVNEIQSAGKKEVNWNRTNSNGENVSPGIYFYTITAGNKHITKKMTVL